MLNLLILVGGNRLLCFLVIDISIVGFIFCRRGRGRRGGKAVTVLTADCSSSCHNHVSLSCGQLLLLYLNFRIHGWAWDRGRSLDYHLLMGRVNSLLLWSADNLLRNHRLHALLRECLLFKEGEVLKKSFEIKLVFAWVDPETPVDELQEFDLQ